ncbi:MAG: 50S ribosomal protein L3, partial [Chloroflexi bacterium]|nr:50S ribosomal protein L3 [Chloroflexota bacterium]
YLREVSADDVAEFEVGQEIDTSLFEAGEIVDATGLTKGRGFAGGVKRHGFHGGPKTHGQSDRHRAPGSIGAGTTPGRVLKGLKMAGHMGNNRVTIRNLEIISVDQERNLLFIKGAVPGARNSLLIIRKTGRRSK